MCACLRSLGLIMCLAFVGVFLCPAKLCAQSPRMGKSFSKTLSFSFSLGERQALNIGGEYVRVASLPNGVEKKVQGRPTWRYKALPLTVDYTYFLVNPDRRLVPFIGAGASYFFGTTRSLNTMGHDVGMLYIEQEASSLETKPYFEERFGMGYGGHALFGFRADMGPNMFLQAQGRCRYINGLGLTTATGEDDLGSKFTKVDFAIGFGFKF